MKRQDAKTPRSSFRTWTPKGAGLGVLASWRFLLCAFVYVTAGCAGSEPGKGTGTGMITGMLA